MSALTGDVVLDRVRSLCVSAPFNFVEATSWSTFDLQPTTNIDAVFRILPLASQVVIGGFAYTEDRTDSMQIWLARKRNGDYDAVRRTLLRDVHSLTAAVVRDGATTSGDYHVPDAGRGHVIADVPTAEYVTLRLTLPINYETQL